MTALPDPFDRDRRKFRARLNNLFYFNAVVVLGGRTGRIYVKLSDTLAETGKRPKRVGARRARG